MDNVSQSNKYHMQRTVISDASGAIVYIILALFTAPLSVFGLPLILGAFQQETNFFMSAAILCLGVAVSAFGLGLAGLFVLTADNRSKGVVFDPENDKLDFFGGGVPAAGIDGYFKWEWLTQGADRYNVPISEISQISARDDIRPRRRQDGSLGEDRRYIASIQGNFGTFDITFKSAARRDQLYSLVRTFNKMGEPVIFP